MRRTALRVRTLVPALGLLAATGVAGRAAQAQYTAYGLVNTAGGGQQLVRFNTGNPAAVTTLGATGQALTGIDFRPATGELFGFNGSTLFTLNLTTGAATQVGTGIGQTVSGNVSFDFNPTVDRIRLVGPGANGTNLRLNPITGGVAATDGAYTFAAGGSPSLSAVAYTNSVGNATTTQLFGIDAAAGTLILVNNPNGGTVTTVGSLGLGTMNGVTGFDIVTVGSTNVGFFTVAGAMGSSLYRIDNFTTPNATLVGTIDGAVSVQGLAIAAVPEPGTWALVGTGLLGVAGLARRRRRAGA